ncbi:cytochrome o ubiquinol oxidase subunit IV [Pseudoroseicyclus aestuarii]|uniref:Cytochrome bo(3) ubiquinol oxidase subunit 4 n=1 Tax=Pseudoroseicyclus aestuarii TaxID=1795041 RepID=A0A318ST22_9RHOB|nr:cytochrome o ubiquinol oxidase subunit IV [Pseudoroseicyclus aestuarii]PYE85111.1 cytochrome o ubiquinol oxidase operon protein cyoD [Pseudoroseicyclus aestuarii]
MSKETATHHHDEHAHDGPDHGSYRSYLTGFVLAAVLTAVPFYLVMTGGFDSSLATALTVMGFAVVQIVVHMIYFLHMNSHSDEGWTAMSLIFTLIIVAILLSGSLWVMYHLNTNMMPQMNHELTGFGS